MLLDYAHTCPDPKIRYHTSDMCLHLDSDSAYLIQSKAQSRVGGHYYLSNRILKETKTADPKPNGPKHTEYNTTQNVMPSAAETETIDVFHNAKTVVPIRTTLNELEHRQPPTTIRTDNNTSYGILTSTIRQKRSKAFDMNIYWIKDRIKKLLF